MAYIIRINDTEACVLSNAEEIRLLQHTGANQPISETRSPTPDFPCSIRLSTSRFPPRPLPSKPRHSRAARSSPPMFGKNPGTPAKLMLQADRASLTADGADISRIIVSAVDENGTETPDCNADITFTLEGNGQLIGENPVKLRAGKMIILAQSSFSPGKLSIRASANGLAPASTEVVTTAPPSSVDMPADLPAKQPTTARLIVKGGERATVQAQPLVFEAKQNVEPDRWIESDPIMLDTSAPLSISGGEYRVYTVQLDRQIRQSRRWRRRFCPCEVLRQSTRNQHRDPHGWKSKGAVHRDNPPVIH